MVVVPAFKPVTFPEPSTVAMKLLADVQIPPIVEEVRLMLLPSHTALAPEIAATIGVAFTVTATIEDCVVQPAALVTIT
jgi:hypothetical protein